MLARSYRLKTRAVNFVVRRGRGISGPCLRLKWAFSRGNVSRATVVVGLVVDKRATKRNLLKRRIREVLRPVLPRLHSPADIIVFTNKRATESSFEDLRQETLLLLKKARLL